ncbi:MAG: ornithine cyclodeaminase family protein [Acidobacteriota bacterium]|nr:ornithine cyclodeaminase family protein [Acidobacteriota bacterium]
MRAIFCPVLESLSEDQVERLLDPQQCIVALEKAFRQNYPGVRMPTRMQLPAGEGGVMLVMPCHDPALPATGVKLVTVAEQPDAAGERVHASYVLYHPVTLEPRLLLAARRLTEIRTAAASALATRFLAREDVRVLGVFGAGRQARSHLRILPLVRRFERVLVCGSSREQSRRFAEEMGAALKVKVEPVEARACVEQADVLCTCTTATQPLFDGSWIRPGTHLNLVGAFQPEAREVDDATVQRARVVVDTYDGALAEAGDLLLPMRRGVISREHLTADLHQLVSGKKPGRSSPEEITLFKSLGCALEDLVAATLVSEAWKREKG